MAGPSSRLHPPGEHEVHVWVGSVASAAGYITQFQELLSDDENARASKFRFDKNRHEFIVSRGMLRTLLASYLGGSAAGLRFTYSAYGKPRLEEAKNPGILTFNLSHSDGVIVCAFARNREVGVDVEKMRQDFSTEEIAERFFSAGERIALRALPAEHRRQGFFNCWTRKEAYIKARGEGLSLPLHQFDVSLSPAEHRRQGFFNCWTRKEAYIKARGEGLSLPLPQFDVSLSPAEPAALLRTRPDANEASRWSLHDLEVPPGYAAALAVEIGRSTSSALAAPDVSTG